MKTTTHWGWKLGLPVLAAALLAGPAALFDRTAPSTAVAADDKKGSELEDIMDVINSGQKKLKRIIKDATKKDDILGILRGMQVASCQSKAHNPKMVADVPAADRPKFLDNYKKGMNHLTKHLIVVEELVIDGKMDDAAVEYEKLTQMKKDYHEKFIKE